MIFDTAILTLLFWCTLGAAQNGVDRNDASVVQSGYNVDPQPGQAWAIVHQTPGTNNAQISTTSLSNSIPNAGYGQFQVDEAAKGANVQPTIGRIETSTTTSSMAGSTSTVPTTLSEIILFSTKASSSSLSLALGSNPPATSGSSLTPISGPSPSPTGGSSSSQTTGSSPSPPPADSPLPKKVDPLMEAFFKGDYEIKILTIRCLAKVPQSDKGSNIPIISVEKNTGQQNLSTDKVAYPQSISYGPTTNGQVTTGSTTTLSVPTGPTPQNVDHVLKSIPLCPPGTFLSVH